MASPDYAAEDNYVLVDVFVQNNTDAEIEVNFFEKMQLQIGIDYITCFDPMEVYDIVNWAGAPRAGTILPKHSIKLTLPYPISKMLFDYNGLKDNSCYMVFQIWPERHFVRLQ